jgi:hypothetical protein
MDKSTPRRFDRLRPTSGLGVLLLGGALLFLLGVVAAASRVHHTPGSRAGIHQPPSGVGDYLFSIAAVIAIAGALFMVYLWFSERDLLAQQHKQSNGTFRALAFVVAIGVVAAIVSHFPGLHIGRSLTQHRPTLGNQSKNLKKLAGHRGQAAPPEFKWLPVFLATAGGLSVLGVIGARAIRRSRLGLVEAHRLEQEFEQLVEDTLADLYGEKDPRRAIIAAYARVERIFATYGFPRDPSEAPVEYLDRVLVELRASGAALRRLTGLFEWAKFSAHDVDPAMRDEAIGALVEVRNELQANRREDELRKPKAAA